MAGASYIWSSFLGGEWSQNAQGRVDDPAYRTALNVCLNSMPTTTGSWSRRSGTAFAQTTRRGAPGRVIKFDFQEQSPYQTEWTDGHLRFFSGRSLIATNDATAVTSISTANPAVALLGAAVTWSSGDQGYFGGGAAVPALLQNRVFALTKVDTTHFSLADALTGAAIDGAALSALGAGVTLNRVLDIVTPYTGALWGDLRLIQTDIPTANATTPGAILLHGAIKPQILQVVTPPTDSAAATFTFGPAVFRDGPYFDPVPGGTLATPSALIGNVTITLSFPAYDASRSYATGDYVTSASVNYKSLIDANLANTPASSPSDWTPVSAADAIGPNGFQGSDVGRLIRLYSEPAIWAAGTTYAAGAIVAYGGSGDQYIGAAYYQALVGSNTGNVPGIDPTKWTVSPTAATWTWGRITGLSNIINPALSGSINIGDMTGGGGLAAAFDGTLSKVATASAEKSATGSTTITLSSYVGKNYSGASNQKIAQATVYPSSDAGFVNVALAPGETLTSISVTLNLRAKASAPSLPSDGTLLGTSGALANTTAPVTVVSSDQSTAWAYVWWEQVSTVVIGGGP